MEKASPREGSPGDGSFRAVSRTTTLIGSVDSPRYVMLNRGVARCRACLKLDIADYPDESPAQEEFKRRFVKEMAQVLGHLLAQQLDAEGVDRVRQVMGRVQRCASCFWTAS